MTVPHSLIEVQDNNVRSPPAVQMQLIEPSITAAVDFVLDFCKMRIESPLSLWERGRA